MRRDSKVQASVWLKSVLVTLILTTHSAAFSLDWRTVSSETYTLLWKDLTFTQLQVDPGQAQPKNADILAPAYAKQIIIEYKVGVSADRFKKMTNKALEGAFSQVELAPVADDIARFSNWYLAVEKGDRYRLTWLPSSGLGLYLNDKPLGVITAPESAALILSVWLGRAAVSEEQRDNMLAAWRATSPDAYSER
jgi:hypothetical protein